MRKRDIHSVAHWAMMFLLLMFPILMTGLYVGVKGEHNVNYTTVDVEYRYETNELSSNDDILLDNVYHIDREFYPDDFNESCNFRFTLLNGVITYDFEAIDDMYHDLYQAYSTADYSFYYYTNGVDSDDYISFSYANGFVSSLLVNSLYFENCDITILWYETLPDDFYSFLSSSSFNVIDDVSIDTVSYPSEINVWASQFLNLPINSWYNSLLSVIGINVSYETTMNIIYAMPVYILWVFIFDVIVDCFLVIIKLPHKLLNRLSGGENE